MRIRTSRNQPERAGEARLEQIRREAESHAQVTPSAQRITAITGASAEKGYYGLPLLKAAPWEWEIPTYFFVGGAAGGASVIAGAASLAGMDGRLIRDARRLAALGGVLSPPLLIADLGRPSRFLNMLRVFKAQSPMSVGSWTLMFFSSSAMATAWLGKAPAAGGNVLASVSQLVSTLTGLILTTYTGVLLGATAVPVWCENSALLPVHFAASGLGSAVGLLELLGHSSSGPLNVLGIASASTETAIGSRIEIRSDRVLQPLKSGPTGWVTRLGGVLSGPLPLALRLLAANSDTQKSRTVRRIAAVSTIAGSALTRIAWLKAGRASVRDSKLQLAGPQ